MNDYFIMSKELYASTQNRFKVNITDQIESDHMPIEFYVNFEELPVQETNMN